MRAPVVCDARARRESRADTGDVERRADAGDPASDEPRASCRVDRAPPTSSCVRRSSNAQSLFLYRCCVQYDVPRGWARPARGRASCLAARNPVTQRTHGQRWRAAPSETDSSASKQERAEKRAERAMFAPRARVRRRPASRQPTPSSRRRDCDLSILAAARPAVTSKAQRQRRRRRARASRRRRSRRRAR